MVNDDLIKKGFVCITNSDCTEGRGRQIYFGWTLNRFTASRLAKGKGVQGTNADVKPIDIYVIKDTQYGPIMLERPNQKDKEEEDQYKSREAMLDLLKAKGITAEEIEKAFNVSLKG